MKKKKRIRLGTMMLAVLLCSLLSCVLPGAIEADAAGMPGEICLLHPAAGVSVELYQVGTVNEDGDIVLAPEYAEYQVNLEAANAAELLSAYISRDKEAKGYQPLKTAVTEDTEASENAQAVFEGLDAAVYLLICSDVTVDQVLYRALPVMLQLPQWKDNELQYQIRMFAKYTKEQVPEETEKTVLKVWKDADGVKHPESIVVQLLKDGVLAGEREDAEVTLNAENNWTYTWKGLDGKSTWTVVEKEVPSGYTVSITSSDENICITNTGSTPPPSNPPGTLPKTGQLWWPVLVLLVSGLFLILVGLLISGRERV